MNIADAMKLMRSMRKDVTTTGISTGSNLNFYQLEPEAKAVYPVLFPLLASIPRTNPMFNGMRVGGTQTNWKAIVGIANGGYPAISEGNRSQAMKFTERDYASIYKYLGQDDFVTYQAERTGLGFEDNLSLSMSATLNQQLNDEERMILFGNSGTGGNGFQLGTAGTPTITGPTSGGAVPNSTQIYVVAVALTGWGVTMAGLTGVQLPFVRTTMNGAQDTINGGTSIYSAISAQSSAAGSSTGTFQATTTAKKGAMGYAWYVGTSNAYGSLYFYGVTPSCTVTITSVPANTNQAANATSISGTASLATDNSANALDFDGETTWAFSQGGYWNDLGGSNLTGVGDSTIVEFDAVQDSLWTQYKIPIGKIWLGGTLINAVTKKIMGAGIANNVTRAEYRRDEMGNLIGGDRATGYTIKYGPNAGKNAPIDTHPWLPQGVIFFELIENPYPAAANTIPAVRRMVTLEDHFGVKWPDVTLQKQYGVYVFETMQHYIPFGMAVLTGVGNS